MEYTYAAHLFEETASGKLKPRSTSDFIEMDDERESMFGGGCADAILDAVAGYTMVDADKFFDVKMFPENDYVTIITEVPVPATTFGRKFPVTMPADCGSKRIVFEVRRL
jgi:hypothetical protein